MIELISSAIIPIIILFIVVYGVKQKINIYDVFIEGAKESIEIAINLFPSMLAMIFGVNIFLKSGIIDFIFKNITFLNIPHQIIPMIIMRPISGSSALAILTNIFASFGPDSFIGVLGSILQGSTDTTFYILTIYFGTVGVKKIKYALTAGIITDLVCVIMSILVVFLLMSF